MTVQKAKQLARGRLGDKRFAHTENVAAMARELARRYGADEEKAETAAWLHDIMKECPQADLLRLADGDAIISRWFGQNPPPTWHGPAAALYLRGECGCTDEELLAAVAWHTTGRADMGLLEKVIYLADAVSAERSYPGVENLRSLARQNLDEAVIAYMQYSIAFLQSTGRPVGEATRQALQSLRQGSPPGNG